MYERQPVLEINFGSNWAIIMSRAGICEHFVKRHVGTISGFEVIMCVVTFSLFTGRAARDKAQTTRQVVFLYRLQPEPHYVGFQS